MTSLFTIIMLMICFMPTLHAQHNVTVEGEPEAAPACGPHYMPMVMIAVIVAYMWLSEFIFRGVININIRGLNILIADSNAGSKWITQANSALALVAVAAIGNLPHAALYERSCACCALVSLVLLTSISQADRYKAKLQVARAQQPNAPQIDQ